MPLQAPHKTSQAEETGAAPTSITHAQQTFSTTVREALPYPHLQSDLAVGGVALAYDCSYKHISNTHRHRHCGHVRSTHLTPFACRTLAHCTFSPQHSRLKQACVSTHSPLSGALHADYQGGATTPTNQTRPAQRNRRQDAPACRVVPTNSWVLWTHGPKPTSPAPIVQHSFQGAATPRVQSPTLDAHAMQDSTHDAP
jgi:hypothetical protein